MRVRLDNIDHTLVQPGPLDHSELSRVPVIRVFGPSSLGLRCCLHIHQVYPYFYIDYLGSLNLENVRDYIHKLKKSLNHAVALSLRRNPDGPKAKYIRAIILVKGVPFYGFHTGNQPYLKVMVSDPTYVFRIVTILRSGGVMGTRFTTYENHLSYYLQFMCDFGLYGCGWIDIDGEVSLRESKQDAAVDLGDSSFLNSPYHRQTRLPLELDICPYQIRNRTTIEARDIHSSLQIPSTASSEHLVHSVRELWDDERRRRAVNGLHPSPDMPTILSETRRGKGGEWIDLSRLESLINDHCELEKRDGRIYQQRNKPWEKLVLDTFDSTEALWEPSKRRRGKFHVYEAGNQLDIDNNWSVMTIQGQMDHEMGEIHVDEALISRQDMNTVMEEDNADREVDDIGEAEDNEEEGLQDLDNRSRRELSQINGDETTSCDNHQNDSHDIELDVFLANGDTNEGPPKASDSQSKLFRSSSWKGSKFGSDDPAFRTGVGSDIDLHTNVSFSSTFRPATFATLDSDLISRKPKTYVYGFIPPDASSLTKSLSTHGLSSREYKDPFYSNSDDLPERPREYAGQLFDLTRGVGIAYLPSWIPNFVNEDNKKENIRAGWEYTGWPPSKRNAGLWLKNQHTCSNTQVEGNTLRLNSHHSTQGSGLYPSIGHTENIREKQNMTLLALEVFAKTTHGIVPDPNMDKLLAVLYIYQGGNADIDTISEVKHGAFLVIGEEEINPVLLGDFADLEIFENELDLINATIDLVLTLDPDILVGWEVQGASWGYLEARGKEFGLDICDSIGRGPARPMGNSSDQWGLRTTSTLKVVGRHVLNVWRLMRVELSLTSYTFENVCFHLLQRRIPKYTQATLTEWMSNSIPSQVARVLRHLLNRALMTLQILDKADVITKTARGSQFKVESFMFRIAKPENFVLISPSKSDVGKQNAAECMPLIMEPYSAFYKGPVVVLDFQSLYPSIMIAYNYCYSTCLGRVQPFKGKNKLGVTHLNNAPGLLSHLRDCLNISPNGMLFVKPQVRRGLLGRMLTELLDTRVMVKQAMKTARGDKALQRVLEARQLGLKYIANVTYGYTSATFSGRMPAVEIADAIVQSGRETLEKAIDLIESTEKWGAKVVYGDTDSLFIYLDGRTKDQAFVIGNEIADVITALNPAPIKLKFEKVYLPCVLMAKKRYVGFKYERPDDPAPKFDAKGIETVRRDGIPAQQKMLERCLNDKGPPPPGAVVAGRRALIDPNDEPQYGERIPYVILRGEPGMKLVDRVVSPEHVLNNSNKHIDAEYYISRVLIPPLERVFNLIGADVRGWYNSLVKGAIADNVAASMSPSKIESASGAEDVLDEQEKAAIDSYYQSTRCILCRARAEDVICLTCRSSPDEATYAILCKIHDAQDRSKHTHSVCASCTLSPPQEGIMCDNLDCPWLYARKGATHDMDSLEGMYELVEEIGAQDQLVPFSQRAVTSV
ncbi:hypothetical protein Clacol_003917 [Clathrus columnatus]|uniref:DNA polymerase n=1 Tax=Clathrus columnatus TaxID=1419009 RepID=A0AAV5A8C2_9AGAM|nr:hypothetical protein Clacol_003917 [Clathrus columnatus]